MGVTIRCSLHLWTSSFSLPFYPNVVPAPAFSAALFRSAFRESCHRKIISHSDGHSVVNRQNKKPIHRDIKNQRERCSRFKMMFYVTALKFKDGTVCSSVHSLTVPKSIEVQTSVFSLSIPQALGGLHRILNRNILYSVVVLFQGDFIIPKPSPKIRFMMRFCIVFAKAGHTILLHYLSNALLSANIR